TIVWSMKVIATANTIAASTRFLFDRSGTLTVILDLLRDYPQATAEQLDRAALDDGRDDDREEDDVEEVVAARDLGDHGERGQHDRHRAAQPSPTEDSAFGPGEVAERGGHSHRDRSRE